MSKVDGNSISEMTGHQLMEAEKRLFDLDRDFGEILKKLPISLINFLDIVEKWIHLQRY